MIAEVKDQRYQAFMDWARKANVSVMLRHVADLLEGRCDPYHIAPHVQQQYLDVAGEVNAPPQWWRVLELITQILQEQEEPWQP